MVRHFEVFVSFLPETDSSVPRSATRYPSASSDSSLAEQSKSFFAAKIRLMRESLPPCSPNTPNLPSENSATLCPCELVIFQRVSDEYITPALIDLHWLPVTFRVQFKLLLLLQVITQPKSSLH